MKSAMVELSNVLNKNELAKQAARDMQKTILWIVRVLFIKSCLD